MWQRPPQMLVPALLAIFLTPNLGAAAPDDASNWPCVFNDKGGTRYSTLDQINRDNVTQLKVAWRYKTGDSHSGSTIECTPLVIDGMMYITTVTTNVVALKADTGEQIWRYDPHVGSPDRNLVIANGVNRGVAFWSDGRQRRILVGTTDGRLISLDAASGKPDPAFGTGGTVDLRSGLDREVAKLPYGPTSAPIVFEDLVILGFANGEATPASPGDNRAFDVRSGKEVWRFHAIPREGEYAAETWPQGAWRLRGGANAWGGLTLDAKAGVLFSATGSATSDFYGADRPGDNLFSNCVLAQDAHTGKRLWHFQTVHHDLWDHDNPCPPVLVTVNHDGKQVDAVAQVTKTGYCFVLDRATGKPLFGVTEVPAPPSTLPGEHASPTQPVSVKPPALSKQEFTDDDATNISPEAHEYVMKILKHHPHGAANLAPTTQGTIEFPGYHGGATWAGASFDPTTGFLYVNTNNVPFFCRVKPDARHGFVFTNYDYFNDPDGYPAVKPPWGLLICVDLNRGEILWQVPLGEYPQLKAKGIPQTGTENFGGTIVTAGGLVFIGGSKDEMFHAFDKSTGKLLWEFKLDAGGYATPCTYAVNGKQYVVIAAGGGGKQRTRSGDQFVAFTLP
jgi:quinoprotein glucose dehydrogenase